MDKREDIIRRISAIEEEVERLQNSIEQLEEEKWELEQQLEKMDVEEATKEILEQISLVDDENSSVEDINDYSGTTYIIDKFLSSNNDFLILKNIFSVSPDWKHVSLVVKKASKRVNSKGINLMISDIKKHTGSHVGNYTVPYMKETDRLYALYNELDKIGQLPLEKGQLIPFTVPCRMGAQSSRDRRGFGTEYNGDTVVSEKLYGSHSDFLIIGVRVED